MRNLISANIEVGELKGKGPLGTNLIATNDLAPERATAGFNVVFQSLVVLAGIYALLNFVLAGYNFLSAGNDPKKIQDATGKIWQTFLGLTVVAAAFLLAAIAGKLIFNDYKAILEPSIPTI